MEKPLVIHVEDDAFYASIIQKALESHGLRYHHERNGEDAIRKIRDKQPSLVLLDVGLPGMNGFEVLRTIKDDSDTYQIPVFLLTRLADKDDVLRAFSGGAAQYLIKQHHSTEDIVQHIHRLLEISPLSSYVV